VGRTNDAHARIDVVPNLKEPGGAMSDNQDRLVAVVDDDPAVLESLRFLLEVAGHQVATYGSAAQFLDDQHARSACLILDHHMPTMTGLELATRLRGDGIVTPIMLVTGALSPAISERAAHLGIETVLEKPLNETDLLRFVDAYT
jgi:two-component system response regulator FixJ